MVVSLFSFGVIWLVNRQEETSSLEKSSSVLACTLKECNGWTLEGKVSLTIKD